MHSKDIIIESAFVFSYHLHIYPDQSDKLDYPKHLHLFKTFFSIRAINQFNMRGSLFPHLIHSDSCSIV